MEMSIRQIMFRYYFNLALLLLLPHAMLAQTDTSSADAPPVVLADKKQLRFGFDISRPILNALSDTRSSYEFSVDYHLPKDVYLVLEGGFGGSKMDYPDLQYNSSNAFFRVGVDKSMLQRLFPSDWDFLFVGVRYGVAIINRGSANFLISDPLWGSSSGVVPAKSFTGHWAELTAGLRVELLKGLFAGYTLRGKFLLNSGPFRELPPAYVAGYGKGERTTAFDFNFYLQYALRW